MPLRFVACLGLAWLCAAAPAAAETTRCTPITTLPYVIARQGNYCLTGHLSYAHPGGTAITINSDYVNLDLNGFTIDASSGGSGTTSIGVYAWKRRNITLRGGSLRGFMYGVRIEDDPASGYATGGAHLVEALRIHQCKVRGIRVQGRGVFIRENQVVDTRGTTFFSDVTVIAVEARGPGARVIRNRIVETFGRGSGSGIAIWVRGEAPVVEANRVSNAALDPARPTAGIRVASGAQALVVDNRVLAMNEGIGFDAASSGAYRDNLTNGCTIPFKVDSPQVRDAGNNL